MRMIASESSVTAVSGGGVKGITLKAPVIRDPGTSKSFPSSPALFASTVYPVVTQDQFRGVSGVDLNLPVLQTLLQAQADLLYDGKAELYLISKYGLVVASNKFPDKLGQSIKTLDADLAAHLQQQQAGVSLYKDAMLVTEPIKLDSTESAWKVVVAVPEATALAMATQLANQLNEDSAQTTQSMIGLGLVLLLAFVVLMALGLTIIFGLLDVINMAAVKAVQVILRAVLMVDLSH